MPKSFLFTHKRYDYDDYAAATQVKVELMENEVEEEEFVIKDLSGGIKHHTGTLCDRISTSASSVSSGGYSEEESLSPFPLLGRNNLTSRSQSKPGKNAVRNLVATRHPVAVPKKRGLMSSTITRPEIQIKEETVPTENAPNANFKLVTAVPNVVKRQSDFHHHRGNLIQYSTPPRCHPVSPLLTTQSGSSYQIKLISPPPGGTLSHPSGHHGGGGGRNNAVSRSREDIMKMDTMTPSPLQFIIAAAEQQEQAAEEQMFMEGSRSEDSQQSYHHHHTTQQVGPTSMSTFPIHVLQEQPVNLSVKKVDLFNLTQLAEVSIAAANREMMNTNARSVSNSATISECPSSTPAGVSLTNTPSTCSSTNDGQTKSSQQHASKSAGVWNVSTEGIRTQETTAAGENTVHVKRNGIGEQKKMTKTDTTTKTQVVSKENFGKMKKRNSSSLLIVAPASEKLQNDKNSRVVLPQSNCAITSNNSCTSVSSSSTSSSSAASQRHRCVECGKGFSTLSNLARHRQTHRSLSDASAVKKCPHCDKVYVSMPAFSMHLRTHNQGCKCPYCGKGFSRPWLLQGHIRTHTGEKPFKCGICSKAFADKSNLRAHTQTHSTEKPFACQRCGKLFALKSYLCKHIESSCMKSNRPSGSTASSGNGTGNGSSSVTTTISSTKKHHHHHHHHHHGAINNSSSASSPVSPCSTRGTSPSLTTTMVLSSSSSSSPTNRDIRSAIANATTTVTACSTNNISTTSSSLSNSGNNTNATKTFVHNRKNDVAGAALSKTTNAPVLGFSSHNNNNAESSRPLPKVNDNSNKHSFDGISNCVLLATSSTTTHEFQSSPNPARDNKSFMGKSSKIQKVGGLMG